MVIFDPSAPSLFSRFQNLLAFRGGKTAQSLSQVSVQTQTQSGLSIVTAEGDKVTLSINTAFEGTGVQYNARGVLEGQALTLRANVLESEVISQKQITIEGDLNEQEIQDIKKIVKQVNGLNKDVQSGDVKAALANGQQLAATGTISSIDVRIQHAESFTLSQAFERKVAANSARVGQQVTPGNEGGSGVFSPQDNLLQGLLASKFLAKPEHEQQGRPPRVPYDDLRFASPGSNKSEESFIQKVKDGLRQGVEGLMEFFNKVGEELLRGAEAIAKLADRLKNTVGHQAAKLAKALERLTELLHDGKTEKANQLQDNIDHRLDSLDNTAEKFYSGINKVVDDLTDKVANILDSHEITGSSTREKESTGKEEQVKTGEGNSQNLQGKGKP